MAFETKIPPPPSQRTLARAHVAASDVTRCTLSLVFATFHSDITGTWCSGITPAQHAGGPGFNPQRVHFHCEMGEWESPRGMMSGRIKIQLEIDRCNRGETAHRAAAIGRALEKAVDAACEVAKNAHWNPSASEPVAVH